MKTVYTSASFITIVYSSQLEVKRRVIFALEVVPRDIIFPLTPSGKKLLSYYSHFLLFYLARTRPFGVCTAATMAKATKAEIGPLKSTM